MGCFTELGLHFTFDSISSLALPVVTRALLPILNFSQLDSSALSSQIYMATGVSHSLKFYGLQLDQVI